MAKFDKILKNKRALAFFSILVAFLAWLLVAVFFNSSSRNTIRRVPVEIDNNSPAFQAAGVERVDLDQKTIDILVEGDRSVIGRLKADDFVAKAEINNVTGAGDYSFRVTVERKDPLKNFSVVDPQSYSVMVTLGVMSTKTFKVDPVIADGLIVEEGYVRGEVFSNPRELNIRGPKESIDKVESVKIFVDQKGTLNDTTIYSKQFRDIQLFDKDNNEIKMDSRFSSETKAVDVTVPVLKKATLPVRVDFLGAPSTLKVEDLKYTLSHKEIKVAGPKDSVDKIKEISVGYFDLRNFEAGKQENLTVTLPTGFVATENVKQIHLTFDKTYQNDYFFTVSQINLINAPSNYDITLDTERLYSVEMAGDSSQLGKISASDLVGEIDLSDVEISQGTIRVEVKIKAPNFNKIWALGTYKADIIVKNKGA